MSIETLKHDLKQITERAAAMSTGAEVAAFLRDELLSWLDSLIDEVGEMDASIEDVVHQSVDVLHEESAQVFAGIITSGTVIAAELQTRVGNDRRLLEVIREFRVLTKQGTEILNEIVIPDDDGDDEDDNEDEDPKNLTEGAPKEGNA